MANSIKKIEKILMPIIVIAVFYILVGMLVTAGSTVIYSNLPEGEYAFNGLVSFQVANRAPVTFPFVNPIYSIGVKIINGTGTQCSLQSGAGDIPCGQTLIDLGRIDAGNTESAGVIIRPNRTSFTIEVTAYLDFIGNWAVRTSSCHYEYEGGFSGMYNRTG